MALAKRVARNSSAVVIGNLSVRVVSVLVAILLARYLLVSEYGDYGFVVAYVALFAVVAQLGLEAVLTREISKDKAKASLYVGNAISLSAVMSLVAIAASVIVSWVVWPGGRFVGYTFVASFMLLSGSLGSVCSSILSAELRMEYDAIAKVADRTVSALLIVWIIYSHGALLQVLMATTASNLCSFLVVLASSRKFVRFRPRYDRGTMKYLLSQSWPLALSSELIVIYMRTDKVMLELMKGSEAVGLYTVVFRLTEALGILATALMISFFPLLSYQYPRSETAHRRLYRLAFKYATSLIVPIATAGTFLAKPAIIALFGAKYAPSAPILQILVWAEVFIFIGIVNNRILISVNKQKLDLIFTGLSALGNVVLNLMLIPRHSYVGAAAATLVASATGPIAGFFLVSTRDYSASAFRSLARPAAASCLVAAFLIFVPVGLWLSVAAVVPIYLVSLYALRGISGEDVRFMRDVLGIGRAAREPREEVRMP